MIALTREIQSMESVFRRLDEKAEKRETVIDTLNAAAAGRKLTPAETATRKEMIRQLKQLQALKNRTADLLGQMEEWNG